MSKLTPHTQFEGMIDLMFTDTERIGTFQLLECDEHGTTMAFTDHSGSDNCLACVEDMLQSTLPQKYKLPNYDETMDAINKLSAQSQSTKQESR